MSMQRQIGKPRSNPRRGVDEELADQLLSQITRGPRWRGLAEDLTGHTRLSFDSVGDLDVRLTVVM